MEAEKNLDKYVKSKVRNCNQNQQQLSKTHSENNNQKKNREKRTKN